MKKILTNKKTQTEIVTTVLLILIGIVAVVMVSAFVMNLVRSNLKGTGCLDSLDQLEISLSSTHYNSTSKMLYLGIERGTKDIDLTGILVQYGNDDSSRTMEILKNSELTYLAYRDVITGDWMNGSATNKIKIPSLGEKISYRIDLNDDTRAINSITQISLTSILEKEGVCEKIVDQEKIITKA